MSSTTSFEHDQQLFSDTILKIQIQSTLAKENVKNNKSPVPLLAQSCSLLDNFPINSHSWTPAQETLINSLKLDAWLALSDACIQTKDLIQAEASLHRLSTLQDAAAGPLSLRSKNSRNRSRKPRQSSKDINTIMLGSVHSISPQPDGALPSIVTSPEPSSARSLVESELEVTTEELQAANDLILTWKKLQQVYTDMGKQDMAKNFEKRADKMREHLSSLPERSFQNTININ